MPTPGDPLFQLECVVLFALDVVKGPYIHSCAPANPSELIRSFLEPPTAAAGGSATTPYGAASAASAGTAAATAPPSSPLRRSDTWTEEVPAQRPSFFSSGARRASGSGDGSAPSSQPLGGSALLTSLPLLGASGGGGTTSTSPHFCATPPPAGVNACPSPPVVPGQSITPFTGPSSLTTVARSPSSTANAERAAASSPLAQRRLLGLVDAALTPDDARSFTVRTNAPTITTTTANNNNASVLEENNTIFAISPQTNLSESQQTFPTVSPMVGSFAGMTNASMTSNTGGGTGNSISASAAAAAALRGSTPGQWIGDGGSTGLSMARFPGVDDEGCCGDGGGVNGGVGANHTLPPARASLGSAVPVPVLTASSSPLMQSADTTGRSVPAALTGSFRLDNASASPLATPQHTPPIKAALTSPAVHPEASSTLRHHHGTVGSTPRAAATASTHGATENDRINSYNDVFVPRSEFCRRVLWLYPAESGLLFLYYAEDIPGEHYQRKTLRYSLCLVFCVDKKRMTIGAGLLHQLVRPYCVVLTNIAEELREAEVKYGYMSRGLQAAVLASPRRSLASPHHHNPSQQHYTDPLTSSLTSATPAAPTVTTAASTAPPTTATATAAPSASELDVNARDASPETTEDAEGSSPASLSTATTSVGSVQRAFRFGRRRITNESSARPDNYHLALVERGTPAPPASAASAAARQVKTEDGGDDAGNAANTTTTTTSTAEHSSLTPTSFMSPLPPNTSGFHTSTAAAARGTRAVAVDGERVRKDDAQTLAGEEQARYADTGVATTTSATPKITAKRTTTSTTTTDGTSGSPSHVLTSRTTTGTTPSSYFGTPFSPPGYEAGGPARVGAPHATAVGSDDTGALASTSGAAVSAAENSVASAASPSLTDTDAQTVSPPSSLPMRSRTVSQGAGAFPASSTHSPALVDYLSTTATGTTAPSPISSAVASAGRVGVAGAFPSAAGLPGAKQPLHSAAFTHHYSSSTTTQQRNGTGVEGGGGGGCSSGSSTAHGVSHAVNTLNAFITPTTAPQWTPLSELVEELYRCLRYGGGGEDGRETSAAMTGASSTVTAAPSSAAAAGLPGWLPGGGLMNTARLPRISSGGGLGNRHGSTGRWPAVPSPLGRGPQQQQPTQRAGTQQPYSPLTTHLPGGLRGASWDVGGGGEEDGSGVAQVDGGGDFTTASAAPLFPHSPLSMFAPQRGDVSIVHLSDRLSFHVRRMAPLQAARMIDFAHVPVPIVAYDPKMIEWMDMAVHHVFRLVDGVRTVADLVFGVAMGTTTTLAEVYAEAFRRSSAQEREDLQTGGFVQKVATEEGAGTTKGLSVGSGGSRDKASSRGSSVGGRAGAKRLAGQSVHRTTPSSRAEDRHSATVTASQHGNTASGAPMQPRPLVVLVPIDARPSLALLPGVRYSTPTSAAAAAAISDGQVPPPSHVQVRVAPPTPEPAGDHNASPSSAMVGRAAGAFSTAGVTSPSSGSPPPPRISIELPTTWVATTGIVVEALLHLELCHLLKIYRPWTNTTLYSATPALHRVLRSGPHPARLVLAEHLLRMAWAERQEMRRERHARRKAADAAAASLKAQHAEQQKQQQQQMLDGDGGEGSGGDGSASPTHPPAAARQTAPRSSLHSPSLSPATAHTGGLPRALPVSQSPSDRTSWLPAAAAPAATAASVQHLQQPLYGNTCQPSVSALSSGISSLLPRPPATSSSSGGGGGALDGGSNANTHASSISTSYALSCSLKHSVSVGASGRLQMNLAGSLLTSPMLRPTMVGGAAQRPQGSRLTQRWLVEGLPSPADMTHGLPGQSQHHHGGASSTSTDSSSNSSRGSSSSDTSSSSGRCDAPGGAAGEPAVPTAGRSSSTSARSRSGTSEQKHSRQASSPVSFKPRSSLPGSRHRERGFASSASSGSTTPTSSSTSSTAHHKQTDGTDLLPHPLPTLLVTSASSPPKADHIITAAATTSTSSKLVSSSLLTGQPEEVRQTAPRRASTETGRVWPRFADASSSDLHSPVGRFQVDPTSSASRQQTDPASVMTSSGTAERKRRGPKPLKRTPELEVFAPTYADLAQAAAAALCALAKFGNTTVTAVQAEMRRMPVWAPSFNYWSERCVHALVEVAVLNNWLEDVSP